MVLALCGSTFGYPRGVATNRRSEQNGKSSRCSSRKFRDRKNLGFAHEDGVAFHCAPIGCADQDQVRAAPQDRMEQFFGSLFCLSNLSQVHLAIVFVLDGIDTDRK